MTMCIERTPLVFHKDVGIYVKHEEKCCPGGPDFSKTRGVYAHLAKRPEKVIGVLDTSHSQGGWAVAKACSLLKKKCVLFYPVLKSSAPYWPGPLGYQQLAARDLGAELRPMMAGRSAILYHRAKRILAEEYSSSYMMPNALKLEETVGETAREFQRTKLPRGIGSIVVSASSGTIAAGVFRGARQRGWDGEIVVHLGYSRSLGAVYEYLAKMSGVALGNHMIIDEGYAYADEARPGVTPSFPSNIYYDLKAFRWLMKEGILKVKPLTVFWNIG